MTTDRRTQNNKPDQQDKKPNLPPYSIEAEDALLGAALLSGEALEVLATKTEPTDFYKPANKLIAEAMVFYFARGEAVDPVLIADHLKREDNLDAIGGPSTLISLQANTPATSNAGRYAKIVHDDATLRRMLHSADAVAAIARSRPLDVHAAVEEAQKSIAAVAAQNGNRSFSTLDIPDMASVMADDFALEEPSILVRNDGKALIYPGKMHVLQAEPSVGKSWIALYTALEVLNIGGAVVYIDYEDSVKGIRSRLLSLGATPDAVANQFQYVRPTGGMGVTERAELVALFRKLNPDLVIIDGVAEALSRDGYDEDRNAEVIKWVDSYPRWITEMGSSVIMLDHITKDKEKRGRYARGAGAKLATIDGVTYEVKVLSAFSRRRAGAIKLIVAKDRPGSVGEVGYTAAVFRVNPSADGEVVRIEVEPAPEPVTVSDSWKPTRLMERMSLELEQASSPLPQKMLVELMAASNKMNLVKDAVARLKLEHYISTYKIGSTEYVRLHKPYRQGNSPLPPPSEQMKLETEEKPRDELAERRARRERYDDGDPGPTEPTD